MTKAHSTEFSLQEMFNNCYDKQLKKLVFFNGAVAIDGPDSGKVVLIGAKYNSTINDYELLTAGSGTTTPTTDGIGYWTIGTDFVVG